LASILIGYGLGGIPSGLWVGRVRGIDLTASGSRNIGATNAFRVLGPRWGALVFLLDAAKGFLAVAVARAMGAATQARADQWVLPALLGGVAAILGHIFTPWLRFRGGRGVATSLGVFLSLAPTPTLVAFGLWILLVALSRRVSVGSVVAAGVYPFIVFAMLLGSPERAPVTWVAALIAVLVIIRHIPNIRRILSGTEPAIFGRKREDHA